MLPLVVGTAIYVGFRSPRLLGWRWGESLGVYDVTRAARDAIRSTHVALPDWIVFTLPDALWQYALAFAMAHIWWRSPKRERWAWLALPVALGPGAELAQALGLVPGTFDPLDLVSCIGAIAAAWIVVARRVSPPASAVAFSSGTIRGRQPG